MARSRQGEPFGPDFADTFSVAVGDLNGDGLLDIVAGTNGQSAIYLNSSRLADRAANSGPILAVVQPTMTLNADFVSTPNILASTEITIPFSLFDPQGRPVGRVEAHYSTNGGGTWRVAEPVAITDTVNLTTGYQVQVSQVITRASPVTEGIAVTGTLVVSDSHTVDDLEVWLSLRHPRVADLYARLISPSGDSVDLFRYADIEGIEVRGTVFDDHSPMTVTKTVTEGLAPFSGRYRPAASLSIFNHKPMTGTWTLLIEDKAGEDRVILEAWGLSIATPPAQYVFSWDTLKSGLFGRSDNVVIRMIAYPQAPADAPKAPGSYHYHNATAGPLLRPHTAATTFPFRVQGTRIRVVDGRNGHSDEYPLGDATAVRLRQGTERNAQPFTASNNVIALSNTEGFVQSPGEIHAGDSVAAMWPVTATQAITLHTPLRRYTVAAAARVPPSQAIESTLTVSDVRRMGSFELTAGFSLTPTTSTRAWVSHSSIRPATRFHSSQLLQTQPRRCRKPYCRRWTMAPPYRSTA